MSSRQNSNGRGICLYRVHLCHTIAVYYAECCLATPCSFSTLMLFKYLTKLVEIRQAGLSVDMDRIYVETLLHPLGIMEAA